MKRIIVAMTGASGVAYGLALLRGLKEAGDVESHLIVSDAAKRVIELESEVGLEEFQSLATRVYGLGEMDAGPASGSWQCEGMVVCPCSMATLAAVATGVGRNLIHRAADVTLKERRPLVLVTRETPLSRVHLRNMLAADEAGAVVLPACPGFYHRPETVEDLVEQMASRVLDLLGVSHSMGKRWESPTGC
jgi:flavin prenyltransferase